MKRLSRVYWFTIEFGVLREDGRVKVYGTGLLSSAGELEAMHRAELRPLDLEAASRQQYDPTHFLALLRRLFRPDVYGTQRLSPDAWEELFHWG